MDHARDDVIAWAAGKPMGRITGYRGASQRCPITNFLREARGLKDPVVLGYKYFDGRGRTLALGAWLTALRITVDATGSRGSPVTAGELLGLIDRIPHARTS